MGGRAGDLGHDRGADAVEEVLHGRLGHPVQQHPVDRAPNGAEGRSVLGADGQLGPVLAERADLDVGLQPGSSPSSPSGSQVRGSDVMEG